MITSPPQPDRIPRHLAVIMDGNGRWARQRRRELSKHVHAGGEDAKVAIRNIRRDANHHIKELLKDKQITEDEERRSEEEIQKLTDKAIKDVDDVVKAKEQELMAI